MCGVAGQVGRPSPEAVERALGRLAHRGPDQRGAHGGDRVALGHTRLSILDLTEEGRQPMTAGEGRVWVVFNGEIYNHHDLRDELRGATFRSRTDTEVLIHGYERWGIEGLLRRVRGMFAFGLWDERQGVFHAARDHLGKKPLFYAQRAGSLSFASTLPSLLELLGTTPTVSHESVLDYLVNTYVPAPWSIFEGVQKLCPGHLLTFRPGHAATIEPYWTMPRATVLSRSEGEWLEATDSALRTAVQRRLEADVPLGAFLSGGIDSSLVVAAMAERSAQVVTLSMGFEGEGNELPFARSVARHFGTDHHEQVLRRDDLAVLPQLVWHFGEPFGDHAALPNWLIARAARRHLTVVLTGDGGDEAFGGYATYIAARAAELVGRTGLLARARIPEHVVARLSATRLRKLARMAVMASGRGSYRLDATGARGFRGWIERVAAPRLRRILAATRVDAQRDALWERTAGRAWVDRALEVDLLSQLPDDFLVKVDVTTMAHSLEARSPFLDLDLVLMSRQVPAHLKVRRGRTKYLLRELAKRRLPEHLSRRPKQGFSPPTSSWFRGEREAALRAIVLSPRALQRGYFDPAALRSMWDEHRAGRRDHGQRLWLLLLLELWHMMFVDGELRATDQVV